MRLVTFIAVAVAAMLLSVCIGCGEQSGEDLKKQIEDGRFNQEEALQAIESASEYRRQVAAEFLAKLGDKKVIKPLIKHMHKDPSMKVRKICLNGLLARAKEKGPGADVETLVPEFIETLKGEDANFRQKGVFALGELRTEDGYKAILEMLKDKAAEVRVETVKSLAKFGKKEALAELVKLYDDEASVRRVAVEKIAEIGGPDAIDLLIPALQNDDYSVKRMAVDELGKMKAQRKTSSRYLRQTTRLFVKRPRTRLASCANAPP
jgi:HEAT repeat protein